MKRKDFHYYIIILFSIVSYGCKPELPNITDPGEFLCNRTYFTAKDQQTGRMASRVQEKTSSDGLTKIVITMYIANTMFKQSNPFLEAKTKNHLAVSVNPDEVLVGGGAAVLSFDGKVWRPCEKNEYGIETKAYLSSSYPIDDNSFSTWAADSKDLGGYPEIEYKHQLEVTAVGMKVFYKGVQIPKKELSNIMSITKESLTFQSQYICDQTGNVISKGEPLSAGVKTCFPGTRGGIFIAYLVRGNEYGTAQSTVFSYSGDYVTNGTVESYCLSIKNFNPRNPLKKLFIPLESFKSIPIEYPWSIAQDDYTYTANDGLVIGIHGGTKPINQGLRGIPPGYVDLSNGISPTGSSDYFIRAIYCQRPLNTSSSWEAAGQLGTSGRGDPNIPFVSSIGLSHNRNQIYLLEIIPN